MSFEAAPNQPQEVVFAFLQVYSQASPFSGLNSREDLAVGFGQFADAAPSTVAAALTDTFSLQNASEWSRLLLANNMLPLIGAEVAVSWPSSHNLPLSLLLLVENAQGYRNLCRLISLGLQEAGSRPLTANLSIETLTRYHVGLVAISPYYGGPVSSALQIKGNKGFAEARSRTEDLRTIFGPDNFFLGVPPSFTGGLSLPGTESSDLQSDATIKLNAALNKLARELGIGLIATGEVRYLQPEQAAEYHTLHNRLTPALVEQFRREQLAQKIDWLYALSSNHPVAGLNIQSPAEMAARYNEVDWPGAIAANREVARRCLNFRVDTGEAEAFHEIKKRCQSQLAKRYGSTESDLPPLEQLPDEVQARHWLDSELEEIEDLQLSQELLAATKIVEQAQPSQVLMPRWLGGSLVAYLLGLTERPPINDDFTETPYSRFETYANNRPIRIETGRDGRVRLLASLNSGAIEPEEWLAAPVASVASEAGTVPNLHPRLLALSLNHQKLTELVPLQPAEVDASKRTELAAQLGAVPPGNVGVLEIRQSAALCRLQLCLDLTNGWLISQTKEPLELRYLPQPSDDAYESPGEFERALIRTRLDYFRVNYPAAYYGASLSLIEPEQRLALVEAARQEKLKILPPSVNRSKVDFSCEDANTLRTGLAVTIGLDGAEQLVQARGTGFTDLNDFARKTELSSPQIARLIWSGALDVWGPRAALAASTEKIGQYGKRYREWQAQSKEDLSFLQPSTAPQNDDAGQMSLFSLFSDSEAAAIVPENIEPTLLELPALAEIPLLEKLSRQREVLNFDTIEHPLWNFRLAPVGEDIQPGFIALTDLTKQSEQRGVRVAGLVVGVRHLPVKADTDGKGQELTVVKLEDWLGRAELVVPPEVAENHQQLLQEGQAVAVLGRLANLPEVPVLVAEAVAAFPEDSGDLSGLFDTVSDDDKFDIEAELEKIKRETLAKALAELEAQSPNSSGSDGGPSSEDWAASLFAEVGATAPNVAANSTVNKSPGSKAAAKTNKAARPRQRRVSIYLPNFPSNDAEVEFFRQIAELLRQHPGDDPVLLFDKDRSGNWVRYETMSLTVAISPEFEREAERLLGPEGFKVEELEF